MAQEPLRTGLSAIDSTTESYEMRSPLGPDKSSPTRGLGKPSQKKRITLSDWFGIAITVVCFAIAVVAVSVTNVAVRLGQTNQLIVMGLTLSGMGFAAFRQAQMLLIVLEARFGRSTLQNYDAIHRNDKLMRQISIVVRTELLALFILPLALSALYKRYVGGSSSVTRQSSIDMSFGPVAPPGLYAGGGTPAFINATSPLFNTTGLPVDYRTNTSYGFNMFVINENVTVMLDAPLSKDLAPIQASLQDNTVKEISAEVNATYCRLNTTKTSPERARSDYWSVVNAIMGKTYNEVGMGVPTWFGIWGRVRDNLYIFMSYWNTSLAQNFTTEAYGFNLYRGTCKGTWLVTSSGIFLESASGFDTNWDPRLLNADAEQTVITNSNNWIQLTNCESVSQFLSDIWNGKTWVPVSPPSVWVSVAAALVWSGIVARVGPEQTFASRDDDGFSDFPSSPFTYLQYSRPYTMVTTVVTIERCWGLYAVLSIQPCLMFLSLLIRFLFFSTPVSEAFGLITLLAGASRSTLDILRGASFSGELSRPIRVQIVVQEEDSKRFGDTGVEVEYVIDGRGNNSPLQKSWNRGSIQQGYTNLS